MEGVFRKSFILNEIIVVFGYDGQRLSLPTLYICILKRMFYNVIANEESNRENVENFTLVCI